MNFIDNLTVKVKLVFLYILCVLVPLFFTNWIFIQIISSNLSNQQRAEIDNSYEKAYIQIKEGVNQCIKLSNIVITDSKFNEAVSKKYEDISDYFNTYDDFLRKYFSSYSFAFPQILQTRIYVENDSLYNGGNYFKIDGGVKNSYWYNQVISNRSKVFHIIGNTGNGIKNLSLVKDNSYLKGEKRYGYIIKIDLDLKYFNEMLDQEFMDSFIYITDENGYIIFSNNSKFCLENNIFSIKDVKKPDGALEIKRSMEDIVSNEEWNVVVFTPKRHIFSNNDFKTKNVYFVLILINLLIPSVAIFVISKSLNTRLKLITKYVKKVDNQKFEYIEHAPARDEIGQLMEAFNSMVLKIKQLINDVYEVSIQKKNIELQKRQAEINALQSQINPHFLFNCLATINMRSLMKGEKETAQIIKNLANLFRISLSWERDMITVNEEIGFVRNYLEIEKYRFGDELKYSIYVDSNAENCRVPKMSLTTFVENACIHGIENKEEHGFISVEVLYLGEFIECKISDNGIGMMEEQINEIKRYIGDENEFKNNVGIKNVIRRLILRFGDKLEYNILSSPNHGVTIWFRIPSVYDEGL